MPAEAAPSRPPRPRLGPEPQRLLVIVLGDYWYWRPEPIPSQVLVTVLGEFGITPVGARAAVRRLTQRGLVRRTRIGRTTSYGIPLRPAEVIVARLKTLFDVAGDEPWDGRWTGVAFSVPEQDRDARRNLRDDLRLQGFGPLFDGLWVSPWDRRAAAHAAVERHGVEAATVFRTELDGMPPESVVARAFDLRDPAERYRRFAERYEPALRRFRELLGRVDPALAELASFHTSESVRRLPDGVAAPRAQETEFERATREDRVRSMRRITP